MESQAQTLKTCSLCVNPLVLRCNTCCVGLCSSCVEKHVSSNRGHIHDVSLYADSPVFSQARVLINVKSPLKNIKRVRFLRGNEVWISGKDKGIRRVDINGSEIGTVNTVSGIFPHDIAVTSSGNLLYSDFRSCTIMEVKDGVISPLIKYEDWTPQGLCSTSDGGLLVSLMKPNFSESKVNRYAGTELIQEIQFDGKRKPIFGTGNFLLYLAENKNKDICIADCNAYQVVVLNIYGKVRFQYNGLTSKSVTKFVPRCIGTDSKSQILVADRENHVVHIISKDGQFVSLIDSCSLSHPCGLAVDDKDRLWIGEFDSGRLKVISY
ncbi:uncharacterized protein LOC133173955 [Saccostrea echinata]|uniref:uncharacterized protein LOC133173955 n=1 Tax=Saccostrea echinata TaxID=191078 RepID=UPI002A80090E|nr:uncharacterized protein LOC133173955 [Saccostrea echinata]